MGLRKLSKIMLLVNVRDCYRVELFLHQLQNNDENVFFFHENLHLFFVIANYIIHIAYVTRTIRTRHLLPHLSKFKSFEYLSNFTYINTYIQAIKLITLLLTAWVKEDSYYYCSSTQPCAARKASASHKARSLARST